MQTAPQQGAGYCEHQQTTSQRVREQYPYIGHSASLVEVGKSRPGIGFFLLDMSIRVAPPVLRVHAEIGRGERDAPVFRLYDLATAPWNRAAGFLLNAGLGMGQLEFLA